MSIDTDTYDGVKVLLRLRRLGPNVSRAQREELRAVEEFVRRGIGVTVRPSEAARLLGIAPPSLKRWLDNGEIATVITPEGRREVPLTELLDLLEELDRMDESERVGRPLSRIIRERRRQAEQTVDIDRLLPRKHDRGHRLAEAQALAYHRLVAERLDETLVDEASHRLREWRASGRVAAPWIDAWEEILSEPVPSIATAIAADTRDGRALRQTSPFAGALTEQERRRLVHAVRDRVLG